MTCFVIIMFLFGALIFSRDADTLACKITAPLGVICKNMQKVSCMELEAIQLHDMKSGIFEINKIQEAFAAMLGGIRSFSKFVPFEVVKELMKTRKPAVLGVLPRELTIFFSDIAGFTTISESVDPQTLLVLLSEYFDAMSKIILGSGGTLGEYIGDAILAFCKHSFLALSSIVMRFDHGPFMTSAHVIITLMFSHAPPIFTSFAQHHQGTPRSK
jgi:adenylate cyclase